MRHFQEAATIFRRVVSLDPNNCDGWLGLGAALLGAKRQGESVAAFRRAIALQPGSPVAYCNMALTLMDLDRIEEGIDACRKAIFIEPGSAVATFNLGCMLLAQGNFREGWEAYDYRFALGTEKWLREEARAAPWTGKSLKEKSILILGEQGNGDHLQFCRYLAKLSDLGATVSYLAPTRTPSSLRHASRRRPVALRDTRQQPLRFSMPPDAPSRSVQSLGISDPN